MDYRWNRSLLLSRTASPQLLRPLLSPRHRSRSSPRHYSVGATTCGEDRHPPPDHQRVAAARHPWNLHSLSLAGDAYLHRHRTRDVRPPLHRALWTYARVTPDHHLRRDPVPEGLGGPSQVPRRQLPSHSLHRIGIRRRCPSTEKPRIRSRSLHRVPAPASYLR